MFLTESGTGDAGLFSAIEAHFIACTKQIGDNFCVKVVPNTEKGKLSYLSAFTSSFTKWLTAAMRAWFSA